MNTLKLWTPLLYVISLSWIRKCISCSFGFFLSVRLPQSLMRLLTNMFLMHANIPAFVMVCFLTEILNYLLQIPCLLRPSKPQSWSPVSENLKITAPPRWLTKFYPLSPVFVYNGFFYSSLSLYLADRLVPEFLNFGAKLYFYSTPFVF